MTCDTTATAGEFFFSDSTAVRLWRVNRYFYFFYFLGGLHDYDRFAAPENVINSNTAPRNSTAWRRTTCFTE